MELEYIQKNDNRAKVLQVLQGFKEQGKKRIDVIDLHAMTGLPYPAINVIMHRLEKEGIVHEID